MGVWILRRLLDLFKSWDMGVGRRTLKLYFWGPGVHLNQVILKLLLDVGFGFFSLFFLFFLFCPIELIYWFLIAFPYESTGSPVNWKVEQCCWQCSRRISSSIWTQIFLLCNLQKASRSGRPGVRTKDRSCHSISWSMCYLEYIILSRSLSSTHAHTPLVLHLFFF